MMRTSERNTPFWAVIRLCLGIAQMFGAAVAVTLLARTGLNAGSATAAALTTLCTLVSLALFGGRRRQP